MTSSLRAAGASTTKVLTDLDDVFAEAAGVGHPVRPGRPTAPRPGQAAAAETASQKPHRQTRAAQRGRRCSRRSRRSSRERRNPIDQVAKPNPTNWLVPATSI